VYMYICMYVCMYVCMYTRIHIRIYLYRTNLVLPLSITTSHISQNVCYSRKKFSFFQFCKIKKDDEKRKTSSPENVIRVRTTPLESSFTHFPCKMISRVAITTCIHVTRPSLFRRRYIFPRHNRHDTILICNYSVIMY